MKRISLQAVMEKIRNLELPCPDLVLGIADGGTVPAALIASRLGCAFKLIRINFRDDNNMPKGPRPALLKRCVLPKNALRVLIVDDVSVSSKTIFLAKRLLKGRKVKTLVLTGKADYVLFPEIKYCVKWPWKA